MPKRLTQRLIAPLFCACLSLAASAEEERWYQVELLIFSNEDVVSDERWDPLPSLDYPAAGRFLVYPEANAAREKEQRRVAQALTAAAAGDEPEIEFRVESEVDEFGRQFIRVIPEVELDTPDIPLQQEQTDTDEAATGPAAAEAETDPLPLLPTPFIALPPSMREFRGKAAYMQRTGRYRTLFHETWVQPVPEEAQALPLIIDRSGDSGDWPQLQGSVKLHLSRFLHLETRLWLNTDGAYLPGDWRMPPAPLGPVSVIVEAPEPELEPEPEDESDDVNAGPTAAGDSLSDAEEALEPEGPVYPWRHAVLLEQTRKMRSNELHYIDHPLFGLVVKLTPLDEEQLQLLAEAELAPGDPRALLRRPGPSP